MGVVVYVIVSVGLNKRCVGTFISLANHGNGRKNEEYDPGLKKKRGHN